MCYLNVMMGEEEVDFGTTPASVNARSASLSGFARGYEFFFFFFCSLIDSKINFSLKCIYIQCGKYEDYENIRWQRELRTQIFLVIFVIIRCLIDVWSQFSANSHLCHTAEYTFKNKVPKKLCFHSDAMPYRRTIQGTVLKRTIFKEHFFSQLCLRLLMKPNHWCQ